MTEKEQKKDSHVFRDVIDLMANPATAKDFAEAWNASDMPWLIDMDDPDAPWNTQHTEAEDADLRDMQEIKQEWRNYRLAGDESPPTPPSMLGYR